MIYRAWMIPAQANFKFKGSRRCKTIPLAAQFRGRSRSSQGCGLPGMKPRTVNRMLISTSLSHRSFSAKTPSGGKITARMILQMSPTVMAILLCLYGEESRQHQLPAFFAVYGTRDLLHYDCTCIPSVNSGWHSNQGEPYIAQWHGPCQTQTALCGPSRERYMQLSSSAQHRAVFRQVRTQPLGELRLRSTRY